MHPTWIALAASAALVPTFALAADLPILPGWWKWDSQASVALAPSKPDHRMKCLRPKDIDKVLSGAINHHYVCRYNVAEIEGGRARLEGACTDKHGGTVPISLRGVYTPTSFNLTGRTQMQLGPLPVPVKARIDARRISETCPSGAEQGEAHRSASPGG